MSDDNKKTWRPKRFDMYYNVGENGHVDCSEVEQWTVPGKVEFKPSRQQEKFRKAAYRMSKSGKYFRGEWFRATEAKNYSGMKINERVWQRWISEGEGFKIWFFEEFPMIQEVSEEELKSMDSQFWIGIRDAMQEGEDWAYRQYAKTRFESRNAKQEAEASTELKELRGYFSESTGDRWKLPAGEA